jgi:UDP-glucose 4-epimerase
VLFASSGGAGYGDPEQIPTPEEAPLRPLSPYGASKVAGEVYLGLARDLHSLSTLSLRLANVYGPRQDAKGEAGVVAIFCDAVAAGGRARIFGDGGQSRDFVYVGDVVDAFARAGESDATGAVNVGTGKGTTVRELAAALELEADLDEPIPGEVRHSRLDVTRAEHMLGWRPSTPLAEGLERTLAWTRRPAQAS